MGTAYKKMTALVMLILFSVTTVLGFFSLAQPAHAQLVTAVAADVPRTVDTVLSKVLQGLKVGVLNVASGAVGYALQKIAYPSAVWIASGGKGQGALVLSKGFGSYLADVGNDALGHGFDKLSRAFGKDFCRIGDLNVDLKIKQALRLGIGITTPKDPTSKPNCTATQFFENNLSEAAWKSKFDRTSKSIQNQFNEMLNFSADQSNLGIHLSSLDALSAIVTNAKSSAEKERLEGQGVKADKNKVEDSIKNPAKSIGAELEKLTNAERVQQSAAQINTVIGTGEFQLLPGALATFFLNTLAGTMLKNFQEKGILPFGTGCVDGSQSCLGGSESAGNFTSASGFGGRRAAEALFSDFLTVRTAAVDQFNILGELSNCPDVPGIFNCRADTGFAQALQQAASGVPITLKEAVDRGLIRGDWKLIPPSRVADNANRNCYLNAFCYSNIKALRQLRMVPLGFELAAEQSDPDKPWTLAEVLNGFNDCAYARDASGNITGVVYDPIGKPFCRLIDPSWVLKAPATRCNALVHGATPLSPDVPDRNQECADLSTCVAFNKDGSCINYAYCTRESNAWKFTAPSCSPQYRTCKSFVDENNITKAYVYRSLDTGFCSKETVNCRAYSFTQDAQGAWLDPSGPTSYGVNTGAFFNGSISKQCAPRSAGCSMFQVAANASVNLFLKKAPDYLQCYDANPATPVTDWPRSVAELGLVKGRAECSQYAGVCIADEVGCTYFTSAATSTGAIRVPAKFSSQDVCSAQCVGYAAYREMPTNYSVGQDLAYIIPTSGRSCTAKDEGCAGFTNLSTTAGGLEQVEYFSYLRSCSLPDANKQKNYFTYEGGVAGFQLKPFTLVKDANGAPEYFVRTEADRASYDATCNASLYKAGLASLDCREFNDEDGNVYYRLLSKTIPISESCTPYRLNVTELVPAPQLDATACAARKGYFANGTCQLCLQGGEFRDGSCFYFGLPGGVPNTAGVSNVCSAQVDSCRAYKGSAGNNIRTVFSDTFENQAAASAWNATGLTVSAESVRVGGKSLNFGGAEAYRGFTVVPGRAYEIEFWAKGSGQNIALALRSADGTVSKDFGEVSVGDTWRSYKLGSLEMPGLLNTSAQLVVRNSSGGAVYLDNIVLREVTELVYLVKNSLKVDAACDSTPNDNLPGEALGCSAYTDAAGTKVTVTGFSFLCREGAIGCTAVLDTKNAIGSPTPRLLNIFLTGAEGSLVNLVVGSATATCQVPVGEKGCYTNITGVTLEQVRAQTPKAIVSSTVYVAAPSPSTSPVYMVANQAATCNQTDVGCQYAGLQTLTPTGAQYTVDLIKNDPTTYQQTLCQQEALACKAYSSATGPIYFKDPALTGNKICTYKTGVLVGGVKRNGWFWKDVGVCSNNRAKICTTGNECGQGATCTDLGNQPCYPTYQIDNATFGLWSYGDKGSYQNFVGECPAAQDSCTEFIDRADNDKAYYLIKNDTLDQGSCEGKVSQKEGCALFDQTDVPNKFYATKASYAASDAQQSKAVEPVVGDATRPADANVIIRVTRDRVCGEWLQCRSAHRVWDEKNARWKMVCDAIGRCNKAPESAEEDNISNCANWLEQDPIVSPVPLTAETYVTRDASWAGQDYSGMSIANMYPIEVLSQVDTERSSTSSDWRLLRRVPCAGVNCAVGATPQDELCQVSGSACGAQSSGICLNGVCVQNIDGTTKDILKLAPAQTCRAYPEKDAPFPNSPTIQKAIRQFAGANICQESKNPSSDPAVANACECDYTKVKFGDVLTKYFSYINPNTTDETVIPGSNKQVPAGICLGGSQDGNACAGDIDCYQVDPKTGQAADDGYGNRIKDGTCQKVKQKFQLVGWRGFCLERDLSRTINGDPNQHPCLSWFPIDYLTGTQDINNQYVDAGYRPPSETGGSGGAFYCAQGNAAGGDDSMSVNGYPSSRLLRSKTITIGTQEGGTDGYRKFIPATGVESTLTQMDIERIELTIANGDAYDGNRGSDPEDPNPGATFMIWPNATANVMPHNKPQVSYTTLSNKLGPGVAVTGRYLSQPNDFILFYGSKVIADTSITYLKPDGRMCYPAATYGGLIDQVYPNDSEQNCKDLGGNIFDRQGLYSRTGGNAAGCFNDCARWENSTKLILSPTEGLWDTRVSNTDICFPYGPTTGGHVNNTEGNWHAVRLKFDPVTGKFLGYYMAYCDHSPEAGHVSYNVRFLLKQWCPAVADVTANPLVASENPAPWTNRLWKQPAGGYSIPSLGYIYDTFAAPFGSLSMAGAFNKNRTFEQVNLSVFSSIPDCKSAGVDRCEVAAGVKPSSANSYQDSYIGAPYSCPGGSCVRSLDLQAEADTAASEKTAEQGASYLSSLFARVRKVYQYNGAQGYGLSTSNVFVRDVTEVENGLRPPMIMPVGSCDNTGKCIEIATTTGISVNDSSSGDVKVFTSSARMFVRFFAFADANQMPLRKMEIDWGDGRNYPLEGLFRNTRGYRQSTCNVSAKKCEVQQIDDLSTCSSDADCGGGRCIAQAPGAGFGKCLVTKQLNACVNDQDCNVVPMCVAKNTATTFGTIVDQTCDNNYAQFEHVYQCTRVPYDQGGYFHANPADCGDARSFPNGCCIFNPRVRVRDNWGWYNGYCPGAGGGNGCYDKGTTLGINEGLSVFSPTDALRPWLSYNGPWTPYNGRIIVAPPARAR